MSNLELRHYFFQFLDEIFETLEEMSDLYDQIQKHSELYYVQSKSEISDPEFDALKHSFYDPIHRLVFQINTILKFLEEKYHLETSEFIKILNQAKDNISSLLNIRVEELLNTPKILHNKAEKDIFLLRDMIISTYDV